MSINSFRKPIAVAASAALLSGGGLGVARAVASEPARHPAPHERRAAELHPKAGAVRAGAASGARPSVAAGSC